MSDAGAAIPREEVHRPLLQIAAFCEKVLREKEGVLSLIRVVDRVNVTGPSKEMPQLPIKLVLVIAFKSGDMKGKFAIRVRPTTPSGRELPPFEFSALFEGDDRGVSFVGDFNLVTTEEGLYWFDVYVENDRVTRIPLRVVYLPVPTPPPAQQSPIP